MDAASALRACPLFQGFTETGIGILAGLCAPKGYAPGTPLFVEGMLSESLVVVAVGRVHLTAREPNGQEAPLGELDACETMGELALVTASRRLCTAKAESDVIAFEIRQADFQQLMATKPQACIKLMMAICAQVAERVVANRDALRSLVRRA